ncbi:tubulin-tyrosine ligase family-domain-containing protein [Suillus paluster]|uniref:tubulin-tyrosine ligase family-domain-containing protein n=1 Tax=Suillus paluster TaxID=48578 RepID=UPI001B87A0CE|nr:tubulin-tyrosine ligase family-domain-containing protein [Suillus paluster]KAG1755124.1 tubulin-tyrosine ligase family-domain-containing protein [Suillus paluster]
MAAAFVSWPSAPLTESLVKRALSNLPVSIVTSLPGTHECLRLLQWSTYDAIDHDLTHRNPDHVLSSSYTIRKALIRKHYLARCIHSYLTKHLDSVLKDAVPRTWDLEISYADELDEMWSDQLWDLGNEIDSSSQWWILKPGMADRGMGIRLFNSKDSLYQIFEEFEEYSEDEDQTNDTSVIISQLRHFVIQEYIPCPLLLDPTEKSPSGSVLKLPENLQGHKFHLRAYFVASGALKLFMYDRVLALFRCRSDDDDVIPGNVDLTPHLTNTSLQIDRGEEGVHLLDELSGCYILSGDDTDRRALRLFTPEDIENIKVQMGAVLAETFKAAVEMPIHFQPLPNAFELYGVDFVVSHDPTPLRPGLDSLGNSRMFQVKLLEINSEPAIELTGRRLHGILEDLFVAIEQVAVLPFFTQEVGREPSTEVLVVPRHLRKCLDIKVRGSGGW